MRLALAAPALVLLPACPEPDFAAAARPAGAAELALPLPIFRVPQVDGFNPLLALFVDARDPAAVELNVVFADEDHPLPLIDKLYDGDRWWGWFRLNEDWPYVQFRFQDEGGRRVADVERILMKLRPALPDGTSAPLALSFPGTYAGGQTWLVPVALHHSAELPIGRFERSAGRPVIYVNTWNHLFGERNLNPDWPYVEYREYPVYSGSRRELERLYRAVWCDYGLDW